MLEEKIYQDPIKNFDETKIMDYMEEQFKTKKVVSFERLLAVAVQTYNSKAYLGFIVDELNDIIFDVEDVAYVMGFELKYKKEPLRKGYVSINK